MDGGADVIADPGVACKLSPSNESLSKSHQAKLETLEKKAVHLRLLLEKDFKAADIKWSLFVSAAFSFRYENCLRPFPPAYLKNGAKDMDELLSIVTDVPALDLVLQLLDNLDNLQNISDILDLLFYVLVRLKETSLRTVSPEAHESILSNFNCTAPGTKPQYIFQVINSNKCAAETKWRELAKNHKVFFAFHGDHLENFYSILNVGLQQQNALFGNGVYLSPELSYCLPHSHGGFGWGASCIGGHLSCVAMCEVIDAPEGINYQKRVTNKGDGMYADSHGLNPKINGDEGLDSQLSHYIVTNCELVRVRYLLVYAKQPASMRFPSAIHNRNHAGVRHWLSRHKLFSILFGYGLMLATIGLANNQPINYYYQILLKKLDVAYSSYKV